MLIVFVNTICTMYISEGTALFTVLVTLIPPFLIRKRYVLLELVFNIARGIIVAHNIDVVSPIKK